MSEDDLMHRRSKSHACYRGEEEREDEYGSIMADQQGEAVEREGVDELLRAGCRVDCCDVAGCSPMHRCCTGIASASSLRTALKLAGKADPTPHRGPVKSRTVWRAVPLSSRCSRRRRPRQTLASRRRRP